MKIILPIGLIILLNCFSNFVFGQSYDSTTVTQPEWIWAATTSDGNDNFYIRSSYVSKENNVIKIWVQNKSKSATINKQNYKGVLEKDFIIVDCFKRQFGVLSVIKYSNSGNLISSRHSENPDFEDVVPDTVMEAVLKKICETFNN